MNETKSTRPAVISSEIFKFPLEDREHIEIQVDIMWNTVEIQKPPPKPKARLLAQTTHDLDPKRTAVLTIQRVYPPK